MLSSTNKKSGWFPQAKKHPLLLAAVALLAVLGVIYAFRLAKPAEKESAYHQVQRGDFLVSIVEGGTLQAEREIVIRNEVEGNSRIIYIVPEGTYVKKDQLLVELDTAEATTQLNQQELAHEKAKSTLVKAQNDLEIQRSVSQSAIDAASLKVKFAEIELDKFMKGQRLQELRNAEIEITTVTSDLLLAKDTLDWSEKLFTRGFETKNAVDQARNNLQDLTLKKEKAQTNLWVISTFDHPKMQSKLSSDLEEAKKELSRAKAQGNAMLTQLTADLITQSNSLVLTERKLLTDREQLQKSRLVAPQDGLVVYAMLQSRFSSQSMVEEGAQVRNRQELIKLPDTSKMKVDINIHESHINKISPGQAAYVVLDNLPDHRFQAVVTKVGLLPDAQRSFGNPNLKVYKTEVLINDTIPDVKPGVSARAEIIVTNIPNCLTVPIQAVTTLKGNTVVFVKNNGKAMPVPVEVGLFNTKYIQIVSGLNDGDLVLLSPPFDAQEKDLGGAIIRQGDELPPAEKVPPAPQLQRESDAPKGDPNANPGRRRPRGEPNSDSSGPERPRSLSSEPSDGSRRNGRPNANREEMLKRFDTNGDGQLDETERAAMRERTRSPGTASGASPGGQNGNNSGTRPTQAP